jgi:uncharacterized protein (TIGR02117 family)
MRRRLRGIIGWVLGWLAMLGVCAAAPAGSYPASPWRSDVIYVIAGGWHTELAMPTASISGPLAALAWSVPGPRYLVFGWGARDYYMARNPGLGDLLRAAMPGPAVMLVFPLMAAPDALAGDAVAIPISPAGAERLSRFIWGELAVDRGGTPRGLGGGPYPQSEFYAATGTYDLSRTCNTWTAAALRAAGVPVTATGVVFAGQLLDQLRRPAATPGPGGAGVR